MLRQALFRRFGSGQWDGLLRASGGVGLLAIPLVVWVPQTAPMVGFFLVTMWINGPVSFLFPAVYEPILMLYGQIYPPILVGAIGVSGTLLVEYVNYQLYRRVLDSDALAAIGRSRLSHKAVAGFSKAPFFTIWMCSWLLPYWPMRIVSPLAGYPVDKHLWATFLGRFPRLWFFAALGAWWRVDYLLLLGVSAAAVAVSVTLVLVGKRVVSSTGDQRRPRAIGG